MTRRAVVIALALGFSWFFFQWTHEFGHVLGAIVGGGEVQRVVLDPLSFSRTEVHPNPRPLVTVWAGPIVGCLVGAGVALLVSRRLVERRGLLWWIAGAVLLANGAYIGLGPLVPAGDTAVMRAHGTPDVAMVFFGILGVFFGRACVIRGVRYVKRDRSFRWSSAVFLGIGKFFFAFVGTHW